jgi:heat shock protein HtpX
MTESGSGEAGIRVRVPPAALLSVGLILTVGLARASFDDVEGLVPWWGYLFLILMATAMLALAGAITIDPRPLILRRALAGAALVWLVLLTCAFLLEASTGRRGPDTWVPFLLLAADSLALVGLAATTKGITDDRTDPRGRVGAVVGFAFSILMASGAAVITINLSSALWYAITRGDPADRLPWAAVAAVIMLPLITFGIAALGSRRAAGGTFVAQAATNRRNGLLLLATMVGVVAVTAEIIAISVTGDPVSALWASGFAVMVGVVAAAAAHRFGSAVILDSAGAKPADPKKDPVLLDVVRELSIAANIPVPKTFIIEDGSLNAFATGPDPGHASIAVTRGLVDRLDREEIQGVIGHELSHVRNFDTRYALYIAVFVGLVALMTDGFLRVVVRGWRKGTFFWRGRGKGAAGAFASGLLVGLFLLLVGFLLRAFAPLFAALVQAATSREREFLADATSVEFTRNPIALERALTSIANDRDTLESANRGTQHLWFRNPVRPGSDRRAGLLSTHPSLSARIDRLRVLRGLDPLGTEAAASLARDT